MTCEASNCVSVRDYLTFLFGSKTQKEKKTAARHRKFRIPLNPRTKSEMHVASFVRGKPFAAMATIAVKKKQLRTLS